MNPDSLQERIERKASKNLCLYLGMISGCLTHLSSPQLKSAVVLTEP